MNPKQFEANLDWFGDFIVVRDPCELNKINFLPLNYSVL